LIVNNYDVYYLRSCDLIDKALSRTSQKVRNTIFVPARGKTVETDGNACHQSLALNSPLIQIVLLGSKVEIVLDTDRGPKHDQQYEEQSTAKGV
jgi:hypothetical protein